MDAGTQKILDFLDGRKKNFIIPVYQRPYSWKKQDCVQLMKDLKDVYKRKLKSHFFGSIVYVAEDDGNGPKYIIIDGQQRITTVSLLLIAIRNFLWEHPDLRIEGVNANLINDTYLKDPYDESKKLKLKLVHKDDEAYENLIEGLSIIQSAEISANYNYFYDEICNLPPNELSDLYRAVSSLTVVTISLKPENGDDPQLIFESLNSTGQALEVSDKIRNYVIMSMSGIKQEIFYKKYWEPLEKTVSRAEMDDFIRYYLAVKCRKLYDKKKLYFEFKYYHESSTKSIESILQDMLKFAKYYSVIINPRPQKDKYSSVLTRIGKLDMKSATPLLMDLFSAKDDGDISNEELCLAFDIVESYIARRAICNLPTNVLNKIFVQIGADVDKDVEELNISYFDSFCHEIMNHPGKGKFPNNQEIQDKFAYYELYNSNPKIKKYVLERLENFNNKETVSVEDLVTDGTLTIEHIMPQTLTDEWKKSLGQNWETIHSKYKDTIGNITLTAYNSDYSNSPFEVKKNMQEKGFLSSKLYLNNFLKTCDKWGEQQILERSKILCQKALQVWGIPKDLVYEKSSDELANWDDDINITNKEITQITILNSVIKANNVTDAFRKIHEKLYELEPATYHKANYLWFNKDSSKMRKPHKIGKKAFIETNLSSQAKLNTVKLVAKSLDFNSHDIEYLIQTKQEKQQFDINNESTFWNKECITVGLLAFELFKDLIAKGKIDNGEIENLKTKEYTKMLFNCTDYPVLANNRDENKGNSLHIRYRKKALVFNGKDVYITTQWFEDNRSDLIKWYKEHLYNEDTV